MFVDKNAGKSTADTSLPIKASARIVVPGYASPGALEIRRDAPTACRESVAILLVVSASHRHWVPLSADVSAAFLKGEFQEKDRVLYAWPPRDGPPLPGVPPGALLLMRKGVFGLNDAPRKWWKKVSALLMELGFRQHTMCLGMFALWDAHG